MSLENGKCPSCGGALLLDSSKEKTVCKFCGHEVVIQQAVQKCIVDGIADFDTLLLTAQQAVDFDNDYDKAMEKYKEALNLRPQDYRCYWGLYISEIEGIKFARDYHGFVQMPGDIPQKVEETIQRYGKCAYQFAPENIKPYYYRVMQNDRNTITNPVEEKKKGCYIATAVYGSYDCPQVWVLRRYRDQNLSAHFCGKIFTGEIRK